MAQKLLRLGNHCSRSQVEPHLEAADEAEMAAEMVEATEVEPHLNEMKQRWQHVAHR